MEGVFKDGFERMGEKLPHVDLAMNILKLVEKKELVPYMPEELAPTLEALFRYRIIYFIQALSGLSTYANNSRTQRIGGLTGGLTRRLRIQIPGCSPCRRRLSSIV